WTVGGAGPRADGRDGPDLPRGRGRPGGRRVTRRLALVGLGPGDPELVTAEAARVLNEVDYFLVADKTASHPGTADLIVMREAICERHVTGEWTLVPVRDPERDRDDPADYAGAVRDWHEARAQAFEQALVEHPGEGRKSVV